MRDGDWMRSTDADVVSRSNWVVARTLLIALCAGAVALAGCAAPSPPPELTDPDTTRRGGQSSGSGVPTSAPVGVKNIALWALPLDEFTEGSGHWDNYAEQLLLASCLEQDGFNWPVPWQDLDEEPSPVRNSAMRRLFNLEIAENYGFRPNIEFTKSDKLWEAFLVYQPSEPGFDDAFDACLAGIREKYLIPTPEDGMFAMDLAYEVQEEALSSPDVQEAAGRWRACMDPHGYGQLPDDPNRFPPIELLEELGAVAPAATLEPSARELEIAVTHATCLDSSGYSAALYEKEWTLQEKVVERERPTLDRIGKILRAREAAVREIIAANLPKP